MSDALQQIANNIKQHKSNLMRFETTVPLALKQLDEWRTQGLGRADLTNMSVSLLEGYMTTVSQYLKMDQHIAGNFPSKFWRTEVGSLVAYGYKLILGDRLIDYTEAACILWGRVTKEGTLDREYYATTHKDARARHRDIVTLYQKFLYPQRSAPLLTAYYDPDEKILGHGARVDRDEVKKVHYDPRNK